MINGQLLQLFFATRAVVMHEQNSDPNVCVGVGAKGKDEKLKSGGKTGRMSVNTAQPVFIRAHQTS